MDHRMVTFTPIQARVEVLRCPVRTSYARSLSFALHGARAVVDASPWNISFDLPFESLCLPRASPPARSDRASPLLGLLRPVATQLAPRTSFPVSKRSLAKGHTEERGGVEPRPRSDCGGLDGRLL